MRKTDFFAVIALALAATACGSSKDSQAVGKVAALFGADQGESRILLGAQAVRARDLARHLRDEFTLTRLGIERHAIFNSTAGDCDSMGLESDFGTCTPTCEDTVPNNNAAKVTLACTYPGGETASCGGVTYTLNGGNSTTVLDIDFSNMASPRVSLAMNLIMNISGGGLSGDLACDFGLSFGAGQEDAEIGCDDFDCKWAGDKVSCEEFKKGMEEAEACGGAS